MHAFIWITLYLARWTVATFLTVKRSLRAQNLTSSDRLAGVRVILQTVLGVGPGCSHTWRAPYYRDSRRASLTLS